MVSLWLQKRWGCDVHHLHTISDSHENSSFNTTDTIAVTNHRSYFLARLQASKGPRGKQMCDTSHHPKTLTVKSWWSVPRLGLRFGSVRITSEIHGYSINKKYIDASERVYPMKSNVFDVVSLTCSSSHCPLSPVPCPPLKINLKVCIEGS